jgi:3-oxoacyl-[acyl-carrier-protein] synthase I
MRMALRRRRKVDYINPHATSTPVGDSKEIEAIREVFGDDSAADLGDQVADRPFARRRRRAGGDLFAPDDEQRLHLRERQHRELDPAFADMPIVRSASTTPSSAACCRTRSASAAPTRRWCSKRYDA